METKDDVVVRFESQSDLATIRLAIGASKDFDLELELWDLRAIVAFKDAADVKELAGLAKSEQSRPCKIAALVGDPLSFGMPRMYAVYREQSQIEVSVFRDEATALNGLLEREH